MCSNQYKQITVNTTSSEVTIERPRITITCQTSVLFSQCPSATSLYRKSLQVWNGKRQKIHTHMEEVHA